MSDKDLKKRKPLSRKARNRITAVLVTSLSWQFCLCSCSH
jgi:hypothetical protein